MFAEAWRMEPLTVGEEFSKRVTFELGLKGLIRVVRGRSEGGFLGT